MATPVNNLTQSEVHTEFGKLTDAIATKYMRNCCQANYGEATQVTSLSRRSKNFHHSMPELVSYANNSTFHGT